jgi:hypothetical protein
MSLAQPVESYRAAQRDGTGEPQKSNDDVTRAASHGDAGARGKRGDSGALCSAAATAEALHGTVYELQHRRLSYHKEGPGTRRGHPSTGSPPFDGSSRPTMLPSGSLRVTRRPTGTSYGSSLNV